MDHKEKIAMASVGFFGREMWCCIKMLSAFICKRLCIAKKLRMRISKQVVEMSADPICVVLQILQTKPTLSEFVEQELMLFDQQISRDLLPMVSRLKGESLAIRKKVCRVLGDDVSKQVDSCVIAMDEVTDWHYPAMTYSSLHSKCLTALAEWQAMMKSVLVDVAIKEWAVDRMSEYCFRRGISDKTPLCGYDNPSAIFNSQK